MILFHRSFKKKYRRLREGEKRRCDSRLRIFENNPFHPILYNHSLSGEYEGCWSINIGGDLRAIYRYEEKDAVIFVDVDTHHNLFGS